MMEIQNPEQYSGHVLVVEDNLDNQQMVNLLLHKHGLQVTIVNNGKEAIDQFSHDVYDLILMDIQMPVMDGLEATRRLLASGCMTPIVALTADISEENKEQSRLAGCAAFLSKPINRARFSAVLACYLEPVVEGLYPLYSSLLQQEPEMYELVAAFLEKLPGLNTQIRNAMIQSDITVLADLVHDMKSVGSGYGFPQLAEICQTMGDALARDDMGEVKVLFNEFDRLCERILMGSDGEKLLRQFA